MFRVFKGIATNGRAWRWREIYILSPEGQPNKELKVQNKYKSSSKNFQLGTADEQRTKS
jgi:hypothetical protein